MNAVVFDTLMLARKLEAAGFSAAQAQGTAAALAETLGEHIASRRDLADTEGRLDVRLRETETRLDVRLRETETRLDVGLRETETRLDARIRETATGIRTDLGAEIHGVRTELRTEMRAVRAELRELEQRMTIRLGGMLAAAIVLVGAMVKLL